MEQKNLTEKEIENNVSTGESNVIIIGGKGAEIYNQSILHKLQKFDQIVIKTLDIHLEKTENIIRQWEAIGILPSTKKNRIIWEKKIEEINFEKYGKPLPKTVNYITLTKTEELYKFTNYD